jgi:hypothetical protein
MRLRLAVFIACIALPLSAARPAAWGPSGHRAVALLAQQRLNDTTRVAVEELLEGATMEEVALWADDVRDSTHPHTYNWHFVNIPITSSGYNPTVHCKARPKGDCVVKALARLEAALGDAGSTTRAETLRFVIHFVGDIHQPLHAGDDHDLGGTQRPIARIGGSTQLHSAWDGGVIRASNQSIAQLVQAANTWLATQDEVEIARGDYKDWAEESWRISRDIAYRQVQGDNRINNDERGEAIRIIEKRIARAGVRLAAVLNRALAPGSIGP